MKSEFSNSIKGMAAAPSPWDYLSDDSMGDDATSRHETKLITHDINEIKASTPIEQLAILSDIGEAAEADTGYGFSEATEILRTVSGSNDYSPLIRIVAESSLEKWQSSLDESDEFIPNSETFGYSEGVLPETLPSDTPIYYDTEKMNESQMIAALRDLRANKPGGIYNSEADDEMLEFQNRQAELESGLRHLYYKKNQAKLHQDFPTLDSNKQIIKIASDAAMSIDFEERYDEDALFSHSIKMKEISDAKGNIVAPEKDLAIYLEAVHKNQAIKETLEEKLGMQLVDIPLDAEIQLLKYMTTADNGRFNQLCNTLRKAAPGLRLKLAKNFVATGFGDDFGDSLLDISDSEKLSNTEKERLLDTVEKCRESIERITGLYTEFDDGKFTKEYAKASNERLTDALAVFRQIAKSGTAEADLDWAGHPRFDYNEAIEALEYEAKSLEIISGTLGDVKSGVKGAFAEVVLTRDESLQRLNRTFYNFYSPQHGYVLLYTRPEGSHSFDPTIEFGKERSKYREDSINAGVEASISLTTNPIDPFSLPNPYRPDKHAVRNPRFYDPDMMDKVSAIRLDREGRAPGTEANDALRDPINPIGMVSVDLAAIGDRADTPSGKIARLLSVGGKLREEMSGVTSSLNHNTKWFDQDTYGTAEGFAELVGYIDSMALEWCQKVPPERDAESFSRRKRQALGQKARKIA